MSGLIDGVSKVWVIHPSRPNGLQIYGYSSDLEAVSGIARSALASEGGYQNVELYRDELNRLLRNDRKRRKREDHR